LPYAGRLAGMVVGMLIPSSHYCSHHKKTALRRFFFTFISLSVWFQQRFGMADDVFHRKAKFREQLISGSRLTKSGHANNSAVQADIFIPVVSNSGFHRDAFRHAGRQYGFTVGDILRVEQVGRGQGDYPYFIRYGFPCGTANFY